MRANLMPNTYRECYEYAFAAATDAANRRMRKAGRYTWNRGDSDAAHREFLRVMRSFGVPDNATWQWRRTEAAAA